MRSRIRRGGGGGEGGGQRGMEEEEGFLLVPPKTYLNIQLTPVIQRGELWFRRFSEQSDWRRQITNFPVGGMRYRWMNI